MTVIAQDKPTTLNARVGAVAMMVGALGTGALTFAPILLVPISLLFLMFVTFGLWALCDEMGMKKPLIRGAFVAFAFAAAAKAQALLQIEPNQIARYYIFYAFAVLVALLLWSAAFLHRQRGLKIVGVLGAAVSAAPIVFLVAGHIVVGVGGAFGITALYSMTDETVQTRYAAIDNIDLIFASWAVIASFMLWRGYIIDAEPD